jgi:WD40 repeat protein
MSLRPNARLGRWTTLTAGALLVAWMTVTAADSPKQSPKQGPADAHGDPLPAGARTRMGTLRWRHPDAITFLAYAQDGKAVLTASQDNILRLWDRETGKEIRRFVGPVNPNAAVLQTGGMAWGVPGRGQAAVALSRDGKILAAAFQSKGIQLWDVNSGKEICLIKGPATGVNTLLFAPDGKTLVARGNDRSSFYGYDPGTGREIRVTKFPQKGPGGGGVVINLGGGTAGGMAISPDSKTLAIGEMEFVQNKATNYIRLVELSTGKEMRKIDTAAEGVSAIAYSPNGKILGHSSGNKVVLRDADTDKEIRTINSPGLVASLVFSPDGKTLAAKRRDGVIRLWHADTGKESHQFGELASGPAANVTVFIGFGADLRDFAFAPDGKVIAAAAGLTIRLWSTASGKELPLLGGGHRGPVSTLMLSPDGKMMVSRGADNVIRRWDAATGKELGQFATPQGTTALAFSPDAKSVALGVTDATIRLVDVVSGKEVHQVKGHANGPVALAFAPNGKVLASRGGSDNTIRLHDTVKGAMLREIALPGEKMAANPGGGIGAIAGAGGQTMAFSPDGQTLVTHLTAGPQTVFIQGKPAATQTDDTLRMWDVATGKEIRKITLPQKGLVSLAWSPDGRVLATENFDQTISLWEVASGRERDRLGKPDPKVKPLPTYYYALARPMAGQTLAYSPDGGLLAVKGAANTVRVWDIAAAKEIGQFKGHEGAVQTLAFSRDGQSLASGSNDTTILVWDTTTFKRVTAPALANLSPKEVEALWADLIGDDARKAGQGILRLTLAPKQVTPFLQERLKPVVPVDPKIINQLIADLDSDSFQARSKASDDLAKLGDLAVPPLRKLLAAQPSLESRRRAETLLEKLTAGILSGEQIRLVRAVEVLEKLGPAEARKLLETLAAGAPGALSTREAQMVLERMRK